MNQDQPFPEEDDLAARAAWVERRLKQLRPRPVAFNAESILRAAAETEPQVTLLDRAGRKEETRTARWLAIAASWMCGAVAGTLLTSLLLLPRDADAPAKVSDKAASSHVATSSDMAADETRDVRRDDAELRRDRPRPNAPQWTDDELLVSSQLLDLRRPQANGRGPLMAGDYALRLITRRSSFKAPVAGELERSGNPAGFQAQSPKEMIRAPLSVNPEQLLEELLGTRASSRL